MTKISFPRNVNQALKGADTIFVLAPRADMKNGWFEDLLEPEHAALARAALADVEPGDLGAVAGSPTGAKKPARVLLGVLPDTVSRSNSPTRSEYVYTCANAAGLASKGKVAVICYVDGPGHVLACANAVGRALPLYSRKTGDRKPQGGVSFLALDPAGQALPLDAAGQATVEAGRWAARLVDMPTSELHTDDFVREAKALLKGVAGVTSSVIVGDQLLKQGLGGIHGVGRAAITAPRLLILDYKPAKKTKGQRTISLVGKGIVYDTGGLNIKIGAGMPGMKADMGGAAAVVGAFKALAAGKCKHRVICLAALAENAVDKESYRPDDILDMHSGKTVEINNTDAEGRLLLADGVSFTGRKHKPDAIIDAATLTGAQLVATGLRHAGLCCNRDGLEARAVEAGKVSGDLCHPLLFAPEFYQQEFKSQVADMKNSVANRMNAQSSCAGQFVYKHIDDLDIPWLHIDLAGPSTRNGRGSGFGVALISSLVHLHDAGDLAE